MYINPINPLGIVGLRGLVLLRPGADQGVRASMKSFRQIRSVRLAVAAVILSGTAGVVALTAATSTAQADPESTTAYVGVGADVTQDLFSALTGASQPASTTAQYFTPLHSSKGLTIQSFDADPTGGTTLNPGCITTKTGGPSFDRPNSTTNGIAALLAAVNGTGWENTAATCTNSLVNVTGQIDFARAARGVKTTGTTLTWIPYGRDALGYLYYDHGTGNLASLTAQQLKSIYSSTTGETLINGDEVEGCLTITGSTPRSNLESAVGVSDSVAENEAQIDGCDQLQQNSGNAFYNNVATGSTALPAGVDAVVPISVGNWIGQFNGLGVNNSNLAVSNGLTLGSVTNASGTSLGLPFTTSGGKEAPNTTYYQDTSFGYDVYTVVPTAKVTGNFANAGLVSLFVGPTSALCSAPAQTIVNEFGFDTLNNVGNEGTCGTTTLTGNG